MRRLLQLFTITLFFSTSLTAQISTELSTQENASTNSYVGGYEKFRLGGYGEMAASYMDYGPNRLLPMGSSKMDRGAISIPRFILALDYKFSSSWILGAEIEFEYGGTGAAREIEWHDEGGEYEVEIEKGGEVVLEQFHITKLLHSAFNVRVGHMIVPIGLTNAYHEPINFFGVYRPEGETTILPSTWHENGISFFGAFSGFDYEVMMVAGLDPMGFRNTEWIASGKQGVYEVNTFTSPAFAGRLNYNGIKGLRIGISGHYNQSAKNASKPNSTSHMKNTVNIVTVDAQYKRKNLIARANMVYGTLGDSEALSKVNRRLTNASGYPRTDVASKAVSYGGEVGYNVGSFFGGKAPRIYPFVRYEYYNPMEKTQGSVLADKRLQTSVWTAGINYYALPNLVIKADYTNRRIGGGDYNSENMISAGIAYVGWFLSK
ncbi:hypothetical protein [Parabacteroides sp. PF5-9]|uniref:hypothetical protein n=1 Tax=Parabacteroides sp. PF5-9 TaxID=1742404 RepID=UPI0024732019|nr:hypothetical protein [Parabacteroides sp. PF5-9]MDH6359033.1 hypothetical protein [Parabacteroides sp. PF5-9]